MTEKYAVLSASGGLDSTTLLLNLLSKGYKVFIRNFNYGSKQNVFEKKCLDSVVNFLRDKGYEIDYKEADISSIMGSFKSSLTREDIKTPEGHYSKENQPIIFVPNRNGIFFNLIAGTALTIFEDTKCEVVVCLGVHKGEGGVTYPDCTPEYYEKIFSAFKAGNYDNNVNLYIPYADKYKEDVLRDGINSCKILGLEPKDIYSRTISCYSPNEKGESCGKCPTCIERIEIFKNLGMEDPIEYQE